VPRINFCESLSKVRAFYLDLSQCRWAHCPVRQDDISHRKFKRRHKARMDASLAGVEGKVAQIDRRSDTTVNLGIPTTVNYPAF
jgi:hypothetical protein